MNAVQLRIALACFCALCVRAGVAGPQTLNVQVRTGELRDQPSFLGAVVAPLAYGDAVEVSTQQGPWVKVTKPNGGPTGWVHSSALTKKKVILKAGEDAKAAASSGELALAGKGFNSKVENEFKAQNRNIDFTWIDRMEGLKVPAKKAAAFLEEGQVTPSGEGGAR